MMSEMMTNDAHQHWNLHSTSPPFPLPFIAALECPFTVRVWITLLEKQVPFEFYQLPVKHPTENRYAGRIRMMAMIAADMHMLWIAYDDRE